jgi:hypothetical protein
MARKFQNRLAAPFISEGVSDLEQILAPSGLLPDVRQLSPLLRFPLRAALREALPGLDLVSAPPALGVGPAPPPFQAGL